MVVRPVPLFFVSTLTCDSHVTVGGDGDGDDDDDSRDSFSIHFP